MSARSVLVIAARTGVALPLLLVACKPAGSGVVVPDVDHQATSSPVVRDERNSGSDLGRNSSLTTARTSTTLQSLRPCFDDQGRPVAGQTQEAKPATSSYSACYTQNGILVYPGTEPQKSCYDELIAQVGQRYENIVYQTMPRLYETASQQGARSQAFLQSELQSGTCAQLKAKYP